MTLSDAERAALNSIAGGGLLNPWDHGSTTVGSLKRKGWIEPVKQSWVWAGKKHTQTLYRLTPEGRMAIGATLEFACPFCGLRAGFVPSEPPAVMHDVPQCPKFETLPAHEYARAVNDTMIDDAKLKKLPVWAASNLVYIKPGWSK